MSLLNDPSDQAPTNEDVGSGEFGLMLPRRSTTPKMLEVDQFVVLAASSIVNQDSNSAAAAPPQT